MSIENFILKSDFFNQSVVRLPEEELATSLYTGSNQKKILIVSLKGSENQTDDVFLKKIMESVNINLSKDCTLLLLPKNKDFNWFSLTKQIEFSHLILFGKDLQKLGLQIDFQLYTPFQFQEKELMVAEPLDLIATERAKKGALWNALKLMFVQ